MLRTLFGDLDPTPDAAQATPGFAATAMFGETPSASNGDDARLTELFVAGSPAQAIREHFATARADLDRAGAMITLLDPTRLWAPAVLKALADATGHPLERLHLRERATLRSLALIERAAVQRRDSTPLKVYHADIRAVGLEHDEIANALAERSHMVVVIVGALPLPALEALLRSLLGATRQPGWLCPQLVFMLPPGADDLAARVQRLDWPPRVRAQVLVEPLTGVSSVWNAVLSAWDAAAQDDAAGLTAQAQAAALGRSLATLSRTEGVLGCALLDLARGEVLLLEARAVSAADLRLQAQALLAARHGWQSTAPGHLPACEELMLTAGTRIALLRARSGAADASIFARQGLLVLLERQHANLALVRFKLMEAERHLD